MLFMVEVQYQRQTREAALSYFESHGVTGYGDGLSVEYLWVASNDCLAYVVVRAETLALVEQACQPLRELAEIHIRHIVGMDDL